ncbi:MAG TPA: TetR/AcrR family transcriptional regulator [Terrimicrobiaceae bacterium]
MATGNRRTSVGSRERILTAARELFAARGFKGTTTAAIARNAGLNEALIFRHFPAKQDLFTAILRNKLEEESLARIIDAAECRSVPVEEALRLVAQRFAEAFDPVFLRLYYHSALEDHALSDAFYDQFVSRFVSLVEQLILRGIKENRFRNVDVSVAARAFTGMLRSYFLTNELFPRHALKGDAKEVSLSFCELFLNGVTRRRPLKVA